MTMACSPSKGCKAGTKASKHANGSTPTSAVASSCANGPRSAINSGSQCSSTCAAQ